MAIHVINKVNSRLIDKARFQIFLYVDYYVIQ